MKTKIYFSFVLIFLAVSFVSCRCMDIEIDNNGDYPIKSNISSISFQRSLHPGGGLEGLSIDANDTHYFYDRIPGIVEKFQITVETDAELWDYLRYAFDLYAFKNIGEGEWVELPTGASVRIFSVTIDDETYSFTNNGFNFDNDENFQKMRPFMNIVTFISFGFWREHILPKYND